MTLFKKKICVVSSSRAEYGLLKNLIFKIRKSKKLKLQLIVTGTHLSQRHGLTYKEIIKDNLKIDKKVKILKNSDTSISISKYLSTGVTKFSEIYYKIKPDLISTGNIGCIMQIANGTDIPIVHTVELIDWYTGGPKPQILY